jgi:hypothetical protein
MSERRVLGVWVWSSLLFRSNIDIHVDDPRCLSSLKWKSHSINLFSPLIDGHCWFPWTWRGGSAKLGYLSFKASVCGVFCALFVGSCGEFSLRYEAFLIRPKALKLVLIFIRNFWMWNQSAHRYRRTAIAAVRMRTRWMGGSGLFARTNTNYAYTSCNIPMGFWGKGQRERGRYYLQSISLSLSRTSLSWSLLSLLHYCVQNTPTPEFRTRLFESVGMYFIWLIASILPTVVLGGHIRCPVARKMHKISESAILFRTSWTSSCLNSLWL